MNVPFGFVVGNKWYATCTACRKLVRINKPLVGSMHVCLSDDEERRTLKAQDDFLTRRKV